MSRKSSGSECFCRSTRLDADEKRGSGSGSGIRSEPDPLPSGPPDGGLYAGYQSNCALILNNRGRRMPVGRRQVVPYVAFSVSTEFELVTL